jgi:hypothetical protein
MDNPALRAPVCAGVKFTPILQEAPAARFDPQVIPSKPKSPVFAPVSNQLIGMEVLPVFCNATLLVALVVPTVWFPKFSPVGVSFRNVPFPVSATVCGLPGALSVTTIVPLRAPEAVGEKTTVIVQLAPGLRLPPQSLFWL